jgi:methionyl-tRNA formyltransferase
VELFKETYPRLRAGELHPTPQDLSIGTTHYKRELELASRIELDKPYTARHLLNWLRARTYPSYPACWFYDGNDKYEVRVSITKIVENDE